MHLSGFLNMKSVAQWQKIHWPGRILQAFVNCTLAYFYFGLLY